MSSCLINLSPSDHWGALGANWEWPHASTPVNKRVHAAHGGAPG